jgi:hypothetical protein
MKIIEDFYQRTAKLASDFIEASKTTSNACVAKNDFKRAALKLAVHFYYCRETVSLSKNIQDFYEQNFTNVSFGIV